MHRAIEAELMKKNQTKWWTNKHGLAKWKERKKDKKWKWLEKITAKGTCALKWKKKANKGQAKWKWK